MSDRLNPIPARHSRARHLKKRSPVRRLAVLVVALVVIAGIGVALFSMFGSPTTSASGPRQSTISTATTLAPTSSSARSSSHTSSGSTSSTESSSTSTSTSVVASTTTSPLAPGDITVEVLNGSGAPGAASNSASQLRQAGFTVNGTGDATSYQYNTSLVEYPPGMAVAARFLADHVRGATSVALDGSLSGTVLYLIVGSSFGGVAA